MALFPVPANPFSQKTGGRLKSLVHSSISSRTALRVPFRHPLRSPSSCRYSAPSAPRKSSRTSASAVEGPRQSPATGTGKQSNLPPAERGYFIDWEMIGERLLSACIVDRRSPLVATSVTLVNMEKGPMIGNEPGSRRLSLVSLRGALKPLRRLGHGQQIAPALASRTTVVVVHRCPGDCWRKSTPRSKGWTVAYRVNSFRRLSSPTSSGGTLKISSSATMRERRCLIVFLV